MNSRLEELAALVAGRVTRESEQPITGAATIRDAGPNDITLADGPQLAEALRKSPAAAVVVSDSFIPSERPAIVVGDVHAAFAILVRHFRPGHRTRHAGISPQALVDASARLAERVSVHPGATIGRDVQIGAETVIHSGVRILDGCQIGARCEIFPNAVLYEDTRVGQRVLIHAGAIIGAYGFGYAMSDGRHRLSAQLGYVEIHDDVEIGAGSTIDRGTYGPTVIGEGTKIDNQVMIAHNCRIGRHNLLCSQVGIAGSCTTGDYVVMAGQVGIRDHVHIGDQARLGAKAGVATNIPAGGCYLGTPAMPEREQMQIFASLARLPLIRRQLKQLMRKLQAGEQQGDGDRGAAA